MKNTYTLFAATVLFVSLQAFAQGGGQAAISGTVLDPSGAAISGAKVNITQKGTSAHRVVVTDTAESLTSLRCLPLRIRLRCKPLALSLTRRM